MSLENAQGNNQEIIKRTAEETAIANENLQFIILEEDILSGKELSKEEILKFEELKKIREARDKKNAVGGGDDLDAASNVYEQSLQGRIRQVG